jgi:hypothetical protein
MGSQDFGSSFRSLPGGLELIIACNKSITKVNQKKFQKPYKYALPLKARLMTQFNAAC